MGLKDRLLSAKRYVWSPMTVWLLERGSDTQVRAGADAKVIVDVEGEDDGTPLRIEVSLSLNHTHRVWLLGEVPPVIGRHELTVQIPAALPPSSQWTEYRFVGTLLRTKGSSDEGVSPVKVIGHPDHVFWPDGPRAGSDDPAVAISLDVDTAVVGGTISGRVVPGAATTVEVGPVVDSFVHVEGKSNGVQQVAFQKAAQVETGADGAFTLTIPEGAPPSLTDGDKLRIHYEVRAAGAWARFAVLDPDLLGAGDHTRGMSIASLFG